MSLHRSKGTGSTKNRFQARFEPLEERQCLSASPFKAVLPAASTTPPPATITTNGHSLTVKDTEAGDTITVTDDGIGDLNVTITNSTGGSVATGSGTGIHNVSINATGGDDTVDYTYGATGLTVSAVKSAVKPGTSSSSSNYNESICINVAKGDNTVDFTDSAGLSDTNLSLNISATGGGNTVTESIGALSSSNLSSTFIGTGGTDSLTATLGSLTSSHAFFAAFGGGGDNNLSLSVSGEIDAESLLNAQLDGGFKGGDTIGFTYSGILDGKLVSSTSGSGGGETLSQDITVASGSTGSLYSLIAAGKGSSTNTTPNTLSLTLTDDSGGSATAASTLKNVHATILQQTGDTVNQTVSSNDTADVNVITQKGHGFFFGWFGIGFWSW